MRHRSGPASPVASDGTSGLGGWLRQYVVTAVLFTALDAVWLVGVAPALYDRLLGDLLAPEPRLGAAVAFYALFVAGLVHFVVRPALVAGSWRRALRDGAFFGLVTYATWDLTSLAVLADFPAALVPIDLAWGAALSASVATATVAALRRLDARRR